MDIDKIEELIKECRDIENVESMFRGNFLTDLDEVEEQMKQLKLCVVIEQSEQLPVKQVSTNTKQKECDHDFIWDEISPPWARTLVCKCGERDTSDWQY